MEVPAISANVPLWISYSGRSLHPPIAAAVPEISPRNEFESACSGTTAIEVVKGPWSDVERLGPSLHLPYPRLVSL